MSALSPRQMFLLDEACKPIAEAFEPPYLVGTAVTRQEYRDVDVRLILADERYGRLRKAVGKRGLALLGLAIGEYLAARTGLPIDFQIQQQTAANHHHPGGMRNPLGLRHLGNYGGDAPLLKVTSSEGREQGA
ncbi:MAG: hypothetical protein BGN98_13990 [Microbacterium sp. 69-7]|uniref:hypothetical protein n=1 Tax=Microbacterium sp. 69-7 TaxID=1895784 RepID=UPI000967096B|nr:hypothetical protein [Microbacterium sp. 69-7]OJU44491.1 MAG: hypothetical protein BGN98_13990 [Microbacterium sp. 69-7]